MQPIQDSLFGKMFRESSATKPTLLDVSSVPLSALLPRLKLKGDPDGQVRAWSADPKEIALGDALMLSTSAWPNDACVCSLSDVLETGLIQQRYYLSGKACRGILRRAAKRGKELPMRLREALLAVARELSAEEIPADKIR
jgi:hypothetical protein